MFSTRPPQRRNSASGRIRRKIAIHLTASHGSMNSRSPNFVPGRGLSRLIGTDVGSISASWKAISTRCSGDSPRLRMPPTQVSARPRARRRSCAAGPRSGPSRRPRGSRTRAVSTLWWTRWMPASLSAWARVDAHVADRRAALEVRVLGDQPRALEHLLEVALGEPLALGDHAEAVRAGGLGGAGVLEDLLGLHHRVHRRLRLGEARLRAEAAVLRAAAGLGVDERAEVGASRRSAPRAPATRARSAPRSRRGRSSAPSASASSRVISGGMRREPYGGSRTAPRWTRRPCCG